MVFPLRMGLLLTLIGGLLACAGSRPASLDPDGPFDQTSATGDPADATPQPQPATPPIALAQAPGNPTQPGQSRVDSKGIAQVWVPAGCFPMGSDPQQDPQARPNEQPQHQVCLTPGFWIDQYEVTQAAFQQFIEDGGYSQQEFWSEAGWQWKGDRTQPQDLEGFTDPQQPRVGISWYEAEAYAHWRGGRLPTEAEWEYAARGPEGTLYPWGNAYEVGRANVNETSLGQPWRQTTLPVGSFPNGKSWVGAYDMAGNVWEWTATWYDPTYYQQRIKENPSGPAQGELRVARGSSWYLDPANARSVTRRDRPFVLENVSGIRVVSPTRP